MYTYKFLKCLNSQDLLTRMHRSPLPTAAAVAQWALGWRLGHVPLPWWSAMGWWGPCGWLATSTAPWPLAWKSSQRMEPSTWRWRAMCIQRSCGCWGVAVAPFGDLARTKCLELWSPRIRLSLWRLCITLTHTIPYLLEGGCGSHQSS